MALAARVIAKALVLAGLPALTLAFGAWSPDHQIDHLAAVLAAGDVLLAGGDEPVHLQVHGGSERDYAACSRLFVAAPRCCYQELGR